MPGDSRRVAVTIDADVGPFGRGLATATAETKAFSRELRSTNADADRFTRSMDTSGRQIDKLSGRLELLGQVAGALGPALVPIGAAAIPAVAGLANQLGVAALAGGTAVLAFQGVGTALKALDQYQLEPTAAHLQALQVAMSAVGPAGRRFVQQLEDMKPLLEGIQNTARAGLLPGVTDALEGVATRAPEVNHLIETISTTLGDLLSEAGQGIKGGALDDFIQTLDQEARPALTDLGHSIADVTLGLTDLFRAFVPLSLDFGSGMARAAAGFREWADGLAATQGFQDFVAYLRTTGPEVLDLLGALGNDFVQIAEAAAPLGGPILQSLTAVANAIGAIADSPLGTPIFTAISAISAYNLAMKATAALQEKTFGSRLVGNVKSFGTTFRGMTSEVEAANAQLRVAQAELQTIGVRARDAQFALIPTSQKRAAVRDYAAAQGRVKAATEEVAAAEERAAAGRRASLATIGKSAAAVAGIGLVASGAADKFGLTNTATLALAGSMAGPLGAGVGAAAGALLDANAAASSFNDNLSKINTETNFDAAKARVTALQKQIGDLEHQSGVGDFFGDFGTGVGLLAHGHLSDSGLYDDLERAKQKVAELNREAVIGSPAQQQYAQAIRNSGVAAGHTAAEINGMVAAMQANRTAALGAFDAETQYRQALKDARAEAAKNNAGLRGSSDAALANRGALSQLAAAWNNQSDAVRNNSARFHEARTAFIQTATAMGVPIGQAKKLADRLLAIPKSVVTRAEIAGGLEALRQIQRIKAEIASIPRSVSTTAYVIRANAAGIRSSGGRDGDPSTPYRDGGYTGDFPRHEPVGVVHGREFVFDATSTERAGVENLYALQRSLRGYADGGYVPAAWHMHDPFKGVGSASREPDRLAAAIKHLDAEIRANTHELKNKPSKAERARLEANQKELRKQLSHLTAQRSAVRAFSLSSVLPQKDPTNPFYAGTRSEVRSFQHDFTAAGGAWTKAIRRHAASLEKGALNLDRSTRAIQAETDRRDSLAQTLADTQAQRSELASGIAGMFTSTDLFASQALPSGAQWLSAADRKQFAADPLSRLRSDITNETQFSSLADSLGKSLHGDALSYAEQQGTGALQTLAGMSPADLKSYQQLFDQRAALAARAGSLVGDQRYGAQVAAQTKQLADANAQLAAMNRSQAALIQRIEHMEATLKDAAENSAHLVGAEIRGEVKKGTAKAKAGRR